MDGKGEEWKIRQTFNLVRKSLHAFISSLVWRAFFLGPLLIIVDNVDKHFRIRPRLR
jgi:hypothetical protein